MGRSGKPQLEKPHSLCPNTHPAYRSVAGGSDNPPQGLLMIQEVKVTLFCEEAIQHCHFHRLHSGNAPGPLAKDRYRLGIYGFQPKTTSLLNRIVAVIYQPLYHKEAAQPPSYQAVETPQHPPCLYRPVASKPAFQESVQFLSRLFCRTPQENIGYQIKSEY